MGRAARFQTGLAKAVEAAAAVLRRSRVSLLLAAAPVLALGAALPLLDAGAALAATGALAAALCWPAATLLGKTARDAARTRPTAESLMRAVTLRLDETGEALDVAGQALSILGLPGEMLLGGGFAERILIADRVAFLTALAALRDGGPARVVAARLRLPAGPGVNTPSLYRPFTIELMRTGVAAEPIMAVLRGTGATGDPRDEPPAARDGTERLEAEKSRLLAALGHELRTPLGALIGFADALRSEAFGAFADPRQKEYAELIKRSGDHLLSVLDSSLEASGAAGAIPVRDGSFDLAAALDMCTRMIERAAASKAITVVVDSGRALGAMEGDGRTLQQILLNLLSNAVKFTPKGGRVTLAVSRRDGRLQLSVADTGIGIAEQDLAMLGTPFARVRSEETRDCEGSGLGLSLVKDLVALEGGAMSIESAPRQGTTVTVALPDRAVREGAAIRRLVRLAQETSQGKPGKEEFHGPIRKAG